MGAVGVGQLGIGAEFATSSRDQQQREVSDMIRKMLSGRGAPTIDPTDAGVLFRKAAVQRVFAALVRSTFER